MHTSIISEKFFGEYNKTLLIAKKQQQTHCWLTDIFLSTRPLSSTELLSSKSTQTEGLVADRKWQREK